VRQAIWMLYTASSGTGVTETLRQRFSVVDFSPRTG